MCNLSDTKGTLTRRGSGMTKGRPSHSRRTAAGKGIVSASKLIHGKIISGEYSNESRRNFLYFAQVEKMSLSRHVAASMTELRNSRTFHPPSCPRPPAATSPQVLLQPSVGDQKVPHPDPPFLRGVATLWLRSQRQFFGCCRWSRPLAPAKTRR